MAEDLKNEEKIDEPFPVSESVKTLSPDIVGQYLNVQPNGDIIMGDYTGGAGFAWDQSLHTFSIKGALSASSLDIPDTTTANSFHVSNVGNVWWGATTLAGSTANVLNTGVATFTNMTLTGLQAGSSLAVAYLNGIISQTNLNLANQGWTQTCVFSATDLDTVAWAAGTLVTAGGTTYNIGDGDTGDMAARTFIYLDIAVSTTAYQVTTTASTAVGVGKVLVATAINGAVEPTWEVFGGIGGLNILGTSIVAASITTSEIAANTIVAGNMNVGQLSAISADLGAITAGTIVLPNTGYIRGGQTDYNTGTGFYLGYSGDYKFSIGSSTGKRLTWDGSILTVSGVIKPDMVASDVEIVAANAAKDGADDAYVKVKEITIQCGGTLRTSFELESQNFITTAYGQIYRNGSPIAGTEHTKVDVPYSTFTDDTSGWLAGDKVQLYCKKDGTSNWYIQNFKIKGSLFSTSVDLN